MNAVVPSIQSFATLSYSQVHFKIFYFKNLNFSWLFTWHSLCLHWLIQLLHFCRCGFNLDDSKLSCYWRLLLLFSAQLLLCWLIKVRIRLVKALFMDQFSLWVNYLKKHLKFVVSGGYFGYYSIFARLFAYCFYNNHSWRCSQQWKSSLLVWSFYASRIIHWLSYDVSIGQRCWTVPKCSVVRSIIYSIS